MLVSTCSFGASSTPPSVSTVSRASLTGRGERSGPPEGDGKPLVPMVPPGERVALLQEPFIPLLVLMLGQGGTLTVDLKKLFFLHKASSCRFRLPGSLRLYS